MGTCFLRQVLVIALLLSVCIRPVEAVTGAPVDLTAGLPSSGELLSKTGLKAKHSINLSDTMNFDDCLNFDIESDAEWCKLLFVIPSPALQIKFSYQEPNALLEAGCIRGKSMLKSAQNAASQILTAGIKTPDQQRCVAPLQSQHGQATRYFDDTLVWAITPVARYQGSGSKTQVTQSYTCEYLKMFSMIITIAKFASNIDWSNFKSIGESLKASFNNFKQSLIDGFNEFKDGLLNLPATVQTAISETIGQVKQTFNNAVNTIKNLKTTIGTELTKLKTKLNVLTSKISNFSVSEAWNKFTTNAGNFIDKVKTKWAKMGENGLDLSKELKGVLSNKFVAQLPYVSEMNIIVSELETSSSAYAALKNTPAGATLSPASAKNAISGMISNGGKVVASNYRKVAAMLEKTFLALDESVYHIQVASNGVGTLPSQGNVRQLVDKLYAAAAEAEALDEEIQKHADVLEDIDYIIGQLGGETQPMEVSHYTMGPGGIQTDGFLENGGSQTALNTARESFKSHMELLEDAAMKAEAWQATLQQAQVAEVCRAYFDFDKGVKTMTTFNNTVNASSFVTGVYPEATYLSMGYVQYVVDGKPSQSCPLTSAGYTLSPQVNKAPEKKIQNCEWVCGIGKSIVYEYNKKPGTAINCTLEPKPTAYMPEGSSCETNRLSQLTEDGYYPACNGLKNEIRFNKKLNRYEWTGNFNYVSTVDHRQILENRLASKIRGKVSAALTRYQAVLSKTRRIMLAKDITTEICEPYRPIEVDKKDLEISQSMRQQEKDADMYALEDIMQRQLALTNARPDYGMRKASNPNNRIGLRQNNVDLEGLRVATQFFGGVDYSNGYKEIHSVNILTGEARESVAIPNSVQQFSPNNVMKGAITNSRGAVGEKFGGGMVGVESKLAVAKQKVEEFVELFNKGSFQQRMANAATQYYPFGLSLAFNSANSTWQKHRLGKEAIISNAIYNTHAGMIPWMLCSGSAAINSFIGSELIDMQNLMSKLNCIGAWGLANEHGFTYNQNAFVRKMLVAKRGLNVAAKLKGVQPNLVGIGQFNLDYPFLHSAGQTPYTSGAITGAKTALGGGKGGKHKGSGCYDYGTTDTSWYTPGEAGSSNEAIAQVNVLNAASGVANSVKKLNPLSDEADLGGDRIVATSWKKTACVAKFDGSTIISTFTTGIPAPCEFSILY